MNVSKYERRERFGTITIVHPRMRAIFGKFDDLRQMSRSMRGKSEDERLGLPSLRALPMIGPTGSGKSKIIDTYIKDAAGKE